jgi:hypothetical protein
VITCIDLPLGKKLKKRLEDLEKKANSNSASPEQRPNSLAKPKAPKKKDSTASKSSACSEASSSYSQPIRTPGPQQIGFFSMPEDRLFPEPLSRQLSHSPPPPAPYSIVSTDLFTYPTFSSQSSYPGVSASCPDPAIYSYQTSFASPYPTPMSGDFPVKPEIFSEVDPMPFNLAFAPLSSTDLSHGLAFANHIPQVNPPHHHPA